MNQDTCDKIRDSASFFTKYFELSVQEQQWIYPALNKSFQSTIEIIELIIDSPMTYDVMSETLGVNKNTIIQKINALSEGGFPIEINLEKASYRLLGKPRNLVKRRVQK